MKWMWAFAIVALVATTASAEIGLKTDQKPGLNIPLNTALNTTGGLFDMNRLSFNHTIGVTYSSGQFGGLNQYYLNEMTYKVSEPLVIKAQIGLQNNLSGTPLYGARNGGQTQVVVPYVGVLYQPKPNLRIEFSFSNMPAYYYGRSHFGSTMPY